MKLSIAFHVAVLAGLLFAAIICLMSHKPEDFSALDNPNLYVQGITKLAENAPSDSKGRIIAFVTSMAEIESSSAKALQAQATLTRDFGYMLFSFAFLEALGIFYLLKSRRHSEEKP